MTFNRDKLAAISAVVLAALAARLLVFFLVYSSAPARVLSSDSATYENSALALLRTGNFAVSPDKPDVPQIVRTPGYPAFIAFFYKVFGESRRPVITAQVLISAATIALAAAMAWMLWGAGPALLSALLLALDFASFHSSQLLLSDTLFAFLLAACAAAGLMASRGDGSRGWAFVCVFSLALATMVRPLTLYLAPPALLFLFFTGRARGAKRAVLLVVLAAIPWAVIVGGWQLRNYRVSGSSEFSQIKNINLFFYRGQYIVSRTEGVTMEEAREKLLKPFEGKTGLTEAELYSLYGKEGLRLIIRHPLTALRSMARGFSTMMLVPGETDLLAYLGLPVENTGCFGDLARLSPGEYARKWALGRPWLFLAFLCALGYLAAFYFGAGAALWRLAGDRELLKPPHLLLCGIILYLVALSSGPEAYARFRVPVMPLLAVYSGQGWYLALRSLRKRRNGESPDS